MKKPDGMNNRWEKVDPRKEDEQSSCPVGELNECLKKMMKKIARSVGLPFKYFYKDPDKCATCKCNVMDGCSDTGCVDDTKSADRESE